MNNWTFVSAKKKNKSKKQKKIKLQTLKHKTTNKKERDMLKQYYSYSNTGKKNPRHGQVNRINQIERIRTVNRFNTKVKHPNPEVSIKKEITSELAKSPEKLKNLQLAIQYESLLRKFFPHGSSKGQFNARKRVNRERNEVNLAVRRTFLNFQPKNCPSAPKLKKKTLQQRKRPNFRKCLYKTSLL